VRETKGGEGVWRLEEESETHKEESKGGEKGNGASHKGGRRSGGRRRGWGDGGSGRLDGTEGKRVLVLEIGAVQVLEIEFEVVEKVETTETRIAAATKIKHFGAVGKLEDVVAERGAKRVTTNVENSGRNIKTGEVSDLKDIVGWLLPLHPEGSEIGGVFGDGVGHQFRDRVAVGGGNNKGRWLSSE